MRRTATAWATFGPLRSFVGARFHAGVARRARRHPAGAHAVAVGAARRLHCAPWRLQAPGRAPGTEQSAGTVPCPGLLHRPAVASQNSLRELRSLRSDSCAGSVYEARCARRPQACASRRHRNRPCRVPPAASHGLGCSPRKTKTPLRRCARAGRGAPGRRREGQQGQSGPGDRLCLAYGRASRPGAACKARARGRARSALRHLTRRGCSSAVSEANEASSATGHETEHRRGVGAPAPTAEVKRPGLPGRTFAAECTAPNADDHRQQRAEEDLHLDAARFRALPGIKTTETLTWTATESS